MAEQQSTTPVFIRSDRANIVQYIVSKTMESGTVDHRPVRVYPGLNVLDAADHKAVASQMANTLDVAPTKPLHELPEREAISLIKSTTSKDALELAAKAEKRGGVLLAISSQLDALAQKAKG